MRVPGCIHSKRSVKYGYAQACNGVHMNELRRVGSTAVIGALPFWAMNALIVMRYEPFLVWLRPTGHTSVAELVLLSISLIVPVMPGTWLCMPRRSYQPTLLSAVVGILLLTMGVILGYVFIEEFARCGLATIPQCD